jgi:excisionase family DNA binding protein
MREAFMVNKIAQERGSVIDIRRRFDRRSGFDRRLNGNGERVAGEDLNGQDDIFTTEEACRYLKVSRPTYMKCIASGKIRAKKVGRGWRALKSELNRFLCAE